MIEQNFVGIPFPEGFKHPSPELIDNFIKALREIAGSDNQRFIPFGRSNLGIVNVNEGLFETRKPKSFKFVEYEKLFKNTVPGMQWPKMIFQHEIRLKPKARLLPGEEDLSINVLRPADEDDVSEMFVILSSLRQDKGEKKTDSKSRSGCFILKDCAKVNTKSDKHHPWSVLWLRRDRWDQEHF